MQINNLKTPDSSCSANPISTLRDVLSNSTCFRKQYKWDQWLQENAPKDPMSDDAITSFAVHACESLQPIEM